MKGKKPEGYSSQKRSRCEIELRLGATSCTETATEIVDGLLLCERHALEAKLEGQIACWEGILAHVDLWSREATRRDRPDVVGLLDIERTKAISAMDRASADLALARSHTSGEEGPSEGEELFRRGSLPPRDARPLARGLRRHRRR